MLKLIINIYSSLINENILKIFNFVACELAYEC